MANTRCNGGAFESAGEGTNIQRAIHILLILHGDKAMRMQSQELYWTSPSVEMRFISEKIIIYTSIWYIHEPIDE